VRRTRLEEIAKVSLTKIFGSAKSKMSTVVGWELQPPRVGKPYSLYTGRGKILRTTSLEQVTAEDDKLLIKTVHSLYEIHYLK
jgi:hypothetical protein